MSKDINLRLKAKALNLPAEDYQTGKVKDNRHMFTGRTTLDGVDSDVIRKMYVDGNSRKITALGDDRQNNHFYILKDGSASAMGFFNEKKRNIERVDKSYFLHLRAPWNKRTATIRSSLPVPSWR